jgi:hypothetical protein
MNKNITLLKNIFNEYMNEYLNDKFNIHIWNKITNNLISNNVDNDFYIDVKNNKNSIKLINNKSFIYLNDMYRNTFTNNILEIKIEYINCELLHEFYLKYQHNFSEYELRIINLLFFIFNNLNILKKNKNIFAITNLWIKYLFTIKNKSFNNIIMTLMYNHYNDLISKYNKDIIYIDNDYLFIKNNIDIINRLNKIFKHIEVNEHNLLITDKKKYLLFNDYTIVKNVGY